MQPDLSRTLCAALSHRRTIDPITFAKRVVPFEIVRVSTLPALAEASEVNPVAAVRAGRDERGQR